MQSVSSSITFEIDSPEALSPKTLHLLRNRLQVALDEAAGNVLDEMGVVNTGMHAIHVDEIETEELESDEVTQQFID